MNEITLDIEEINEENETILKMLIDGSTNMMDWPRDLEFLAIKNLLTGLEKKHYEEKGKLSEFETEIAEIEGIIKHLKGSV